MGLQQACTKSYHVADVRFYGEPFQRFGHLFKKTCFGQWGMGEVLDFGAIREY